MMIEGILARLSCSLNRLLSSKQLLSYEEMALYAWRSALSVDQRRILDSQLAAANFIQRQAGDAKVCFFYQDKVKVPLFHDRNFCSHVATIVLTDDEVGEDARMKVKLFVVDGRFFSMEFPKRPKRYAKQHGMRLDSLKVLSVNLHSLLN